MVAAQHEIGLAATAQWRDSSSEPSLARHECRSHPFPSSSGGGSGCFGFSAERSPSPPAVPVAALALACCASSGRRQPAAGHSIRHETRKRSAAAQTARRARPAPRPAPGRRVGRRGAVWARDVRGVADARVRVAAVSAQVLLDVEAGLVAAPAHDVRLVVTLALRGGTLRHLGGLVAGGKGSRQAAASFGAAAADAPSESRSCRFVFPTVSRVTIHAHFMFAPEMTFAADVDALIDWKGAAAAVVLCPIFTVAAQGQRRLRTSQRRLRVSVGRAARSRIRSPANCLTRHPAARGPPVSHQPSGGGSRIAPHACAAARIDTSPGRDAGRGSTSANYGRLPRPAGGSL